MELNNSFRYAELDALANVLFEQVEANRVPVGTKAVIYYRKGEAEKRVYQSSQARQTLGLALSCFREIGARLGEANTLQAIGDVLQFLDRREEALDNYQSALGFYREIGARLGEANVLQEYGKLQDDLSESLKYFSQAQEIYVQIKDRYSQSRNLLFVAEALIGLERHSEARDTLNRTVALAEEIGFEPLRDYVLEVLERIADLIS
ncbi:MAG: hypothetical protein AB4426_16675 [Xenococcaceae cyanobacterium]